MKRLLTTLLVLAMLPAPAFSAVLYENNEPAQVKKMSVNKKMLIAESGVIATQHTAAALAGRNDLIIHYWMTRATIAGLRKIPKLKDKPVTTAVLGFTLVSCKEFFDDKFSLSDIFFGNLPAAVASYREYRSNGNEETKKND